MKRYLTVLIVTLSLIATAASAQHVQEPPKLTIDDILHHAIRFPVAGVPLIDKAPTIDGNLADDEWSGAALIADMLFDNGGSPARNGCPLPNRCSIYLQYDANALYIGYRYELPTGTKPQAQGDPAVRDSSHGAGEDSFDMFINPEAGWSVSEGLHIGGNALGVLYDREVRDAAGRWLYNPPDNQHATQPFPAGNGWTGEFKITFESLDAKTPAPGELWRANFANVRKTPIGFVAAWCMWNGWRGGSAAGRAASFFLREHGWLMFLGQPLAVRVTNGGNTAKFKPLTFDIAGPIPADGVDVEFNLYRRKDVPSTSDRSLLADLAEGVVLTNVGGSAKWGQNFDDQVKYLLNRATPVGDSVARKIRPGAAPSIALPQLTEEGEYALSYQFITGEGDARRILSAGMLPFRIEPDLILELKPMVLEKGELRVDADMVNMLNLSDVTTFAVRAINHDSGKTLGEASATANGANASVRLPVRDWPIGIYDLIAEAKDASGQSLAQVKSPYERVADPDWWTHKAGMNPAVPEPFDPVIVKPLGQRGAEVTIIRRTYRFDGRAIPASILATPNPYYNGENPQPVELLAAPMQWRTKQGDAALDWHTTKFEITEQQPTHVTLHAIEEAAGLKLDTTTKIEFDGMMFVTMNLTGTPDSSIDALDLVIPLRREVAQLMAKSMAAEGPGKSSAGKPESGGRYPDLSKEIVYEDVPWASQFIFNDHVGLEISMESTRGWRMKGLAKAMETRVESDVVTETLRLISLPTTLAETPVRIELGLIAAPIKPTRPDWGTHRYMQEYGPWVPGENSPRNPNNPTYTQEDLDAWYRWQAYTGVDHLGEFFPQQRLDRQWNILPVEDTHLQEVIRKRHALMKAVGVGAIPHAGWYSIYTDLPTFKHFGYEMIKMPAEITIDGSMAAAYNSPWVDWYVANVENEAKTLGSPGLRYDTMNLPVPCFSEDHDNLWIDQYGTRQPTVRLWASREYLKRNYRIFHGGVTTNGFVDITNAKYPTMCQMAFGDMYEVGEGPFERAPTLNDGYPPILVRSLMTHAQFGPRCIVNMKGTPLSPNERLAALLVHGADYRATHRTHTYAEGYEIFNAYIMPNSMRIWDAYDWIGRGALAQWRPYWKNSDTVTISAPGDAKPELYASYYLQPGKRILLVTANYDREPVQDAVVTFDMAKLGFAPDANLHAVDAVTRMPVDLAAGKVTLNMYAQRWRMVEISAEPSRYIESNLGPDQLAWGDFESDLGEGFTITPFKDQLPPTVAVDKTHARRGAASLRVDKQSPAGNVGENFASPPMKLETGDYLLTGYVLRSEPLPAVDAIGFDRYASAAALQVGVSGASLEFDPPLEFRNPSYQGAAFTIKETTPGWQPFCIRFAATAPAADVRVYMKMFTRGDQGGTAWIDDLQLRKLNH